MNAIAEVIQSPVWQWNSEGSSRHKKAQIAFHAMLHQNHELVPAFPCTKCSHVVGIVVRCSGYPKPCENHFHVGCAASFVEQSKTRFKRYYCDSCSLGIHQRQFKQKKKQAKPVRPKPAGKHKSQKGRNLSNDTATKNAVSVSSATAASLSSLAEKRQPQASKSPTTTANAAAGHGHAVVHLEQPPSGANDAPAAMSPDARTNKRKIVDISEQSLKPAKYQKLQSEAESDKVKTVSTNGKGGSAIALSALGMWDPTISEAAIVTLQSMARGGSMAIKDRLMWTKTLRSRCDGV
jgi:hypothetical protein